MTKKWHKVLEIFPIIFCFRTTGLNEFSPIMRKILTDIVWIMIILMTNFDYLIRWRKILQWLYGFYVAFTQVKLKSGFIQD